MIGGVLDIETTGLNPKRDQIIEICVELLDLKSYNLIGNITQRFKPTVSIGKKAQEVHGISIDDLAEEPSFESFKPVLANIFNNCDILFAHNAAFDIPFVAQYMNFVGYDSKLDVDNFCTMQNSRWATYDGKYPSLQELCYAVGVEYDPNKSHSAYYDVSVTTKCIIECLRGNHWEGNLSLDV